MKRRANPDRLMQSIQNLELLLAAGFPGREIEWAGNLCIALDDVEYRLRQEQATGGQTPAAVQELAQDVVPTQERRINELADDRDRILNAVTALLVKLQDAILLQTSSLLFGPDFSAIRMEGRALVLLLHNYRDAEAKLLLEAASVDIGLGD